MTKSAQTTTITRVKVLQKIPRQFNLVKTVDEYVDLHSHQTSSEYTHDCNYFTETVSIPT